MARSYGALAETVAAAGRQPRARVMDILIAATAHAHRAALYTHGRQDFHVFSNAIDLRPV